ncbi:hypothetical protein ABMA27_005303 [Loxostege sticticalis]|uniref:Endonuclease/exonuclease/phosphatase domain-containing protein n=1 Tax=Loxostege sticticalis TaxID=481309 RepID=A0ABR3HIQ1_LOXSC
MLTELNIYYQNIRGMRTKTNVILQNIMLCSYDVIVLTETWLNSSIFDNEFIDSRYRVYRRDRSVLSSSKLDGGGVLIAVSKYIQSSRVPKWETQCEDLWITIDVKLNNCHKKIAICAVYLPSPARLETQNTFTNNVANVLDYTDNVIILGDFNLTHIEWTRKDHTSVMNPIHYNSKIEYALLDFMTLNNLCQFNHVLNCNGRILDLVLSNLSLYKVDQPLASLSKLDPHHPSIVVSIADSVSPKLNTNEYLKSNFFKADYESIAGELEDTDWQSEFSHCVDTDEMILVFYRKIRALIDKHVPKYKYKSKKHPIWFTSALIKLLAEKDKIRVRYLRCKSCLDKCYKQYISKMENSISKNSKAFWQFDDVNKVKQWCDANCMVLNAKKCSFIRYTRKTTPIPSSYKIDGVELQEVTEIRDLGVIIDSKLKFTSHIDNVIKKSSQMLGFVMRNLRPFSSSTIILTFNALVRSILEYCSVVWNPQYVVHSQRLENVQRNFTRRLAFVSHGISHRSSYEQRLSHFELMSLRDRRKLNDLAFLHKALAVSARKYNIYELSLSSS